MYNEKEAIGVLKMTKLSHLNDQGEAKMVDVTGKDVTRREARACARVFMRSETLKLIVSGETSKGDVLAVARVAGIQASKKCSELIPLCHPLSLTSVSIDFEVLENSLIIETCCVLEGRTGVEMEALCGVNAGLLCAWDMLKSVEKDTDGQYPSAQIDGVRVLRKSKGDPHD